MTETGSHHTLIVHRGWYFFSKRLSRIVSVKQSCERNRWLVVFFVCHPFANPVAYKTLAG